MKKKKENPYYTILTMLYGHYLPEDFHLADDKAINWIQEQPLLQQPKIFKELIKVWQRQFAKNKHPKWEDKIGELEASVYQLHKEIIFAKQLRAAYCFENNININTFEFTKQNLITLTTISREKIVAEYLQGKHPDLDEYFFSFAMDCTVNLEKRAKCFDIKNWQAILKDCEPSYPERLARRSVFSY